MSERENQLRKVFISQMQGFLYAHGTNRTDVNRLLDYIKHKTGLSFNYYGAQWIAERDRIRCCRSWESHSFFDDGGGTEGEIDLSISYVGAEGDYLFRNEKLQDLSTYHVATYANAVKEEFYCKDPFGLNGVFKICFSGDEVNTD